MTTPIEHARRAGAFDRDAGRARHECLYDVTDPLGRVLAAAWLAGWDAADAEILEEQRGDYLINEDMLPGSGIPVPGE